MAEAALSAHEPVEVLIVDDQLSGLTTLRTVLEPLGETVVEARSGREALRYLLHHDFAVILLDVLMPDLDGFETATLIRERERSRLTPIIFVTASLTTDAHVFRGYEVGAVDYVLKPVVPEVLRSKVAVFADLARKEAQLAHQAAELTRLNQQLQAQNRDLGALNEELQAFSSTVSHDLKAPLRHIAGFARILVESAGPKLDAEDRGHLETIVGAVQRMSLLIDDLLAFSRLGRAEPRMTSVDLGRLVDGVRAELTDAARGRDIRWSVGPLPTVPGDQGLLRVVFSNLLGNAVKFTAPRAAAEIVVTAQGRGAEDVAIAVRDNGVGYNPQLGGRLFGVFQRLHAQEEFEGTGMGLAIVRRVVERHGGRVWAEGEIDRGATFYVQLPLTLPSASSEESGGNA